MKKGGNTMTDKQIDDFLREYQNYYAQIFNQKWVKQEYPLIYAYAQSLLEQFIRYSKMKTVDRFWADFAKVMTFDAKLHLLEFFIAGLQDSLMELTETDILTLIEKDYVTYHSENMGYKLNQDTASSLFFLIEK
jgi:hypothetical protein